ncbi:unnamed protein product [Medioppia subpectinata]|uniref:Phosphatidylinositol 3,4,5-trisphosphate 3-phosphatase and dual-specificity protein phosphatase PTEN n=1 Tax=Medioppia subpectinata TaxID=1979941 RepID=A0A7R9KZX8_9ACAR|nr:unnamed protein product [Medioppia subpectinata]CAG2113035.1 unnamed protein product [Medioppia subpectinata]
MAAAIKGMVSKNKIRYKAGGFDLDLSYISRNIIAMGFPAETLERFYRNHIDDVVRFFETKHRNNYQIYNLCAESKRRYDTTKFGCKVIEEYAFQDHNPPPFELLQPFCEDVHRWLTADPNNVIAIHCKAGKGRTGVMICAYLIHAGECDISDGGDTVKISSGDKALEYYGRHRTHDMKGVTIPSQKRYVYYYEELVKQGLRYQSEPLRLTAIALSTIPIYNGGAIVLLCEIIQLPKQKLKSLEIDVKKGSKFLHYALTDDVVLRGDIKVEFYIKNKLTKEKIFQFCFNTFFVKSSGSNSAPASAAADSHQQNSGGFSFSNTSNSGSNECFTRGPNSGLQSDGQMKYMFNNSDHTDGAALSACAAASAPVVGNGYSNGQVFNNHRKCSDRNKSNGKELYLVLPKDQLDKAYKDKANRTFTSDFKVKRHTYEN